MLFSPSNFVVALSLLISASEMVVAATVSNNSPMNRVTDLKVLRSENNPLITFESSKVLGDNINGPSVIRVPEWVHEPLGRYYMYFAHHSGKDIRLAYADSPGGPWKIHEPGVLNIRKTKALNSHIASPDVHVDNDNKTIEMFLHGRAPGKKEQQTILATSKDGLDFEPGTKLLGTSYFRVFKWRGRRYAIDGRGYLNRESGTDGGWECRERILFAHDKVDDKFGKRSKVRIRHSAVTLRGDTLVVFYTLKEEAPERILVSTIDLTDDWEQWNPSAPIEVMRPREPYEGVGYKLKPSRAGSAIEVQELRDPCVFEEGGKLYLYYSIAGEMGIAMAELSFSLDSASIPPGKTVSPGTLPQHRRASP